MGNKKDYERVPLPPVQSVGDPAYIRQQQVVLKLKQSFGVSGVSIPFPLTHILWRFTTSSYSSVQLNNAFM